jgi:hypothetical protein
MGKNTRWKLIISLDNKNNIKAGLMSAFLVKINIKAVCLKINSIM